MIWTPMRRTLAGLAIATASFAVPAAAVEAENIDWPAIPVSEITLFYPGQASLQFVTGKEHRKGAARAVLDGENCLECHGGEEEEIGKRIVAGKRLEPKPIEGKRGAIQVRMQAAYDSENLYLKVSWPASQAGAFHEYVVYRDGKWETYATNRNNPAVASGEMKASYEDRFTIMLGDEKTVPTFKTQGCWVTCHNDMRYMPNEPKKQDVSAHAVLGASEMKKDDIRKYIGESRTAMGPSGGWDKIRSRQDIESLKARGVFLELWQWRGYRSNPVRAADDGYVLEYRNFDDGKNPFFNNWDGAKQQPLYMFNPSSHNGRAGLSETDFRSARAPLLTPKTRVPYDPKFPWKNGDLMVKQGLQSPEGSAADNVVTGTFADGGWTLLWKRKLDTGRKDDIVLQSGRSYPIGLAVHDDNVTARFHHVSLPLSLSLGGEGATVNAVRLK